MLGNDDRADAAAYVEGSGYLHVSGLASFYQFIQEPVGYGFVEDAFVAEAVVVELEGLQFDAKLIGNVFEIDGGEVGLTGFGAYRREFRTGVDDRVVTMRSRIWKGLDYRHGEHLFYCVKRLYLGRGLSG